MSVENKQVRGDASVSRNVNAGGNARVQGNMHVGHNLRVDGAIEARNIKAANKGLFLDEAQLKARYPQPEEGWFAGVGSSSPFVVYIARNGEWQRTTGTFSVDVDMDSYNQRIDELESQLESNNALIAELIEIIREGGGSADLVMITIENDNPTWGSVSGGGLKRKGSVTVTATAENGYHFVEWQDAEGVQVSTDATYTFDATESVTLKAVFAVSYFTVTATPNDSDLGSVSVSPAVPAGQSGYTYGTQIALTAVVSDMVNAYFVRWDDGNTDNNRTITLTGDVSLQAIFAEVVRIITTAGEGGNMDIVVRRGGQVVAADEGVRIGDEITLTATGTANKPSAIKCGDTTIVDGEVYHIEYSQDEKTMTCTFIYQDGMPLRYTSEFNGGAITQKYRIRVLVEPEAAGTAEIIQAGESGVTDKEIDAGSHVTIHAQANNGWVFRSWELGNVEVEDDASGEFTFEVTGAATYTAVFIHDGEPDFYYGAVNTPNVGEYAADYTGLSSMLASGYLVDNNKATINGVTYGKTFIYLYDAAKVTPNRVRVIPVGYEQYASDFSGEEIFDTATFHIKNNVVINGTTYTAIELLNGNESEGSEMRAEITFTANNNSQE